MKPSEFWTRVLSLPEQASRARGDADQLQARATALVSWAEEALQVHQRVIALADDGDIGAAERELYALPSAPRESDGATAPQCQDADCPDAELHAPKRRQRSDAGKPRGSRRSTKQSEPANPADVRARDAGRTKRAGLIRETMASTKEPMTMAELVATSGMDEDDVGDALKVLSVASWYNQRDGDSRPVEVWGTYGQLHESLVAQGCADVDDANDRFGVTERDYRLAMGGAR